MQSDDTTPVRGVKAQGICSDSVGSAQYWGRIGRLRKDKMIWERDSPLFQSIFQLPHILEKHFRGLVKCLNGEKLLDHFGAYPRMTYGSCARLDIYSAALRSSTGYLTANLVVVECLEMYVNIVETPRTSS